MARILNNRVQALEKRKTGFVYQLILKTEDETNREAIDRYCAEYGLPGSERYEKKWLPMTHTEMEF
jgi:hypothetical protein